MNAIKRKRMEDSSIDSNQTQAMNAVTVFQLPNELLVLIFKYLKGCDVIAFASTCKRFSSLSQSSTHLNLENDGSSLGQSLPLLKFFFRSHVNPSLLRSCNLNGCYWINVPTLKTFLVKCTNLEGLQVAETQLSIRDIVMGILPKCIKVTKLSFTLKIGDWSSYSLRLGNRKLPTLCRLKSVEIIVADPNNKKSQLKETIAFLRSCENLEEIVICKLRLFPYDELDSTTLFRNPSILKSVIIMAEPAVLVVNQLRARFFDVIEGSNLDTFWSNLLQLPNSTNLNNLTSMALTLTKNQVTYPYTLLGDLHPGLQLGRLESYWEPDPVLMSSTLDSPTQLKLISCFYNHETFKNFCLNHPLLEVLKLGIWFGFSYQEDSTIWNADSWKNLARLRILSLQSSLIRNSCSREPYLSAIIQSCPLIQELEIMGTDGGFRTRSITVEELSSIAQLGSTLKRLTLANIDVKSGLFLEHILKGCNQLESLPLKEIGPFSPCCFASNMITALPLAKKLKTFCLFQKNVPQMELLLESLESCTSISRLSLVCPSWSDSFSKLISEEDFTSRMVRLCEKMSQLVALFCYFRVPMVYCREVNKLLKKKLKMERPAFRVHVESMADENGECDDHENIAYSYNSEEFPIMYKDLLISFQSQVALFPYSYNSFLQRNL